MWLPARGKGARNGVHKGVRTGGRWHEARHVGGDRLITGFDASGNTTARYVFGPGDDEPLVWYEGAGTGDKRDDGRPVPRTGLGSMGCFPPSSLHADESGSVIAVSDASGAVTNINSYDEYGIPGAGNVGRFQYTRAHEPCRGHGEARSQAWIPELGMYYYKARIYSPTLGRFLQTDPIGYADGLNWYNYVGGDPVNATHPSGLLCEDGTEGKTVRACADHGGLAPEVTVRGGWGGGGFSGGRGGSFGGGGATSTVPWPDATDIVPEVVVTARRVVRSVIISAPLKPNYKVFFGYSPDSNSVFHVNRHLTRLTSQQRTQLKNLIKNEISSNFDGSTKRNIDRVFSKGQQYNYCAFLLPNGIINVGTVFPVDD